MQSNKPALKRQREIERAPENLILKESFKFVSQLPLQECIDRLKYISQESAYIALVAPNKVIFNWSQWGTRIGGKTWAVGYVEETGSNTQIIGSTGISLRDFSVYAIPFVIAPFLLGLKYLNYLMCMFPIALVGLFVILLAIRESDARTRNILIGDIQGMFEAKNLQRTQITRPKLSTSRFAPHPPKNAILKSNFVFTVNLPLQEYQHSIKKRCMTKFNCHRTIKTQYTLKHISVASAQ